MDTWNNMWKAEREFSKMYFHMVYLRIYKKIQLEKKPNYPYLK